MQRWTRQSECMFCQLRTTYKRQCLNFESRAYHASSIRLKEIRERNRRQTDNARHTTFRRIDLRQDSKDTIPTSKRKREILQEKFIRDKKHEDSKRKEIERALRRIKKRYLTTTMSKGSSVSQLAGLDPDGNLWPQFESMIKASSENASMTKGGAFVGILDELSGDGLDDTFRANAERAIQFAFMDYVLDNGDPIKTGGSYTADLRYPTEWYPVTRQMQRVIHLHVGPTNSGKTYNALKRLEGAQDGFYAGPLRLLAHEVYSRFNNRGIKCDLITGDDVRLDASGNIKLYASTVEMVDSTRVSEVGVIDEIQMLGDLDRGWAWTRALLAAKVKELHLCGEARVVPLIREIVASLGDTLHIHQYERLNPLKVMSRSLKGNLKNLRKGDCVVSFSIMNIHALKRQIELDTGKRCAIIYGGLPPETRAQQAGLFNDPDNDYDFLAASDAIGMGLNLSIKRVVFETTSKFNGVTREQLSIPQIKQIAGRAGRYRTARDDTGSSPDQVEKTTTSSSNPPKQKSIGLVTCLDERDLPVLQRALSMDGPPLKSAGIHPPGEFYEELASRLPEDTPFEFILRRLNIAVSTNDRFRVCNIRDQLRVARALETVTDLSISDRLTFCASPAPMGRGTDKSVEQVLVALASTVSVGKGVTVADVEEIPLEVLDEPMSSDRNYLASLEALHKSLILFLWLSYRFPRALRDQDMAVRAKELCEDKINTTLLKFSANPKLRERLAEIRKSSETLREQAGYRNTSNESQSTMNPDRTVEELDESQLLAERDQEDDPSLETNVEVEGQLDLGEEDLQGLNPIEEDQADHDRGLMNGKVEERQRAESAG